MSGPQGEPRITTHRAAIPGTQSRPSRLIAPPTAMAVTMGAVPLRPTRIGAKSAPGTLTSMATESSAPEAALLCPRSARIVGSQPSAVK